MPCARARQICRAMQPPPAAQEEKNHDSTLAAPVPPPATPCLRPGRLQGGALIEFVGGGEGAWGGVGAEGARQRGVPLRGTNEGRLHSAARSGTAIALVKRRRTSSRRGPSSPTCDPRTCLFGMQERAALTSDQHSSRNRHLSPIAHSTQSAPPIGGRRHRRRVIPRAPGARAPLRGPTAADPARRRRGPARLRPCGASRGPATPLPRHAFFPGLVGGRNGRARRAAL